MRVSRRTFVKAAAGTAVAPAFIREAEAAANVLRIAHPSPLTGPASEYGIRARDGSTMAVSAINDAGGLVDKKGNAYRLELVVDDVANDPRQAVTLFRRYAQDSSISAVTGPISSPTWVPCVSLAEQLEMPLIGIGSLAILKSWNTWTYRVNPVSSVATPILLRTVVAKKGIKRLGIIYDGSHDGQVATATVAQKAAAQVGYQVVDVEAFRTGEQDFSVYISNLKAANIDGVLIAAQTPEGSRISLQLHDSGVDVPQIAGDGALVDPVWWDNSKGAIMGGYTFLSTDLATSAGALRKWLDTYNGRFKLSATVESIDGYTAIMAIVEAVKQCSSLDRTAIREVLQSLNFTSPIGTKVTWKNPPDGENLSASVNVVQITGRGTYAPLG